MKAGTAVKTAALAVAIGASVSLGWPAATAAQGPDGPPPIAELPVFSGYGPPPPPPAPAQADCWATPSLTPILAPLSPPDGWKVPERRGSVSGGISCLDCDFIAAPMSPPSLGGLLER